MKRIIVVLLIVLLLISQYGCRPGDIKEPVTFYYPRQSSTAEEFAEVVKNGVLGSEVREASGHTADLNYLLSLYLRGPLDTSLKSPFPAGCNLVSVTRDGDTLQVTLDAAFTTLQNMKRTVACACLAKTCFSLTDAAQVQIIAAAADSTDSVDIVITADSLLLEDTSALPQQEATEEPQ